MKLKAYLNRSYDTVFSRHGLTVEYFNMVEWSASIATVEGRLRYWDGSMLRFNEELVEEGLELRKVEYVYHYQAQDGSLIFRYDNLPHYPDLSTHPHHKHVKAGTAERVEAAQPPQLTAVLREIDAILAAAGAQAP